MTTDLTVADHPTTDPSFEPDWRYTDTYPPEQYRMEYLLPRGAERVDEHGKIYALPGLTSADYDLRTAVRLVKQCERIYYWPDFGNESASSRCTGLPVYRVHCAVAPPGEEDMIVCHSCYMDDEYRYDLCHADSIRRLDNGHLVRVQ